MRNPHETGFPLRRITDCLAKALLTKVHSSDEYCVARENPLVYRASSSELKVTSAKPKSLPWTSPKWARLLATTWTEPSQTPPHSRQRWRRGCVGVEGAGDDSQADAVIRDKRFHSSLGHHRKGFLGGILTTTTTIL